PGEILPDLYQRLKSRLNPTTTEQKAGHGSVLKAGIEHEGSRKMFAVIKTGGRQYRVAPDDVIEIGKIEGQVGTIVQLTDVLVLGGDTEVLGAPTVAGASVAAELLQHKRGPKVIAFKKRRRKNSRRKRGYRDELSVIRVTEILADDAKPTIGPRPKKEKVAQAAEADDNTSP